MVSIVGPGVRGQQQEWLPIGGHHLVVLGYELGDDFGVHLFVELAQHPRAGGQPDPLPANRLRMQFAGRREGSGVADPFVGDGGVERRLDSYAGLHDCACRGVRPDVGEGDGIDGGPTGAQVRVTESWRGNHLDGDPDLSHDRATSP